jgi:hypothetical protein
MIMCNLTYINIQQYKYIHTIHEYILDFAVVLLVGIVCINEIIIIDMIHENQFQENSMHNYYYTLQNTKNNSDFFDQHELMLSIIMIIVMNEYA